MIEGLTCPCCAQALNPARQVVLYLASIPRNTEENEAAALARTPSSIFRSINEPPATCYKVLLTLEHEDLIRKADNRVRTPDSQRGRATVYLLTDKGQAIADRLKAEGVTLCRN